MIGVLAHADVGDHDQLGDLFLERAHSHLHRALLVPGRRAGRVFRLRHSEENNSADFRLRRSLGVAQHLIDRRLIYAGHRSDGAAKFLTSAHKNREDQLRRRQVCLANEVSKRVSPAQTARTIVRKAGHSYSGCGAGSLDSCRSSTRRLLPPRDRISAASASPVDSGQRRSSTREPRTMCLPLRSASIPYNVGVPPTSLTSAPIGTWQPPSSAARKARSARVAMNVGPWGGGGRGSLIL